MGYPLVTLAEVKAYLGVTGTQDDARIASAASNASIMAERDTGLPGHLRDMRLPLLPAALAASRAGGDKTERAVVENVTRMRDRLLRVSPVIAGATAAGRLRVVEARYDLDQGVVSLLA